MSAVGSGNREAVRLGLLARPPLTTKLLLPALGSSSSQFPCASLADIAPMVLLLGTFSGGFILYCLERLEGKHQGGSGLVSRVSLALKCLEVESFLQDLEERPNRASRTLTMCVQLFT